MAEAAVSSFKDLANTKLGDVEKPKPYPIGHYEAQFVGRFKEHKAQTGNLAARFAVRLIRPLDDVDADALAEIGGLKTDKTLNLDFWMSADALWRLTEFGQAMGHSADEGVMDLLEALGTSGDTFQVEGKHRQSQDGKDTFFYIDSPAPLPA